jgi:hypothetical protein
MPGTTTAPAIETTSLRALLERSRSGLTDEVIAVARAGGAELAADVVCELLQAELSRWPEGPASGSDRGAAIRAAHLAAELELTGAIPTLVQCVEVLPEYEALHEAVVAAIARFGTAAVEALRAALVRGGTPAARARLSAALSRRVVDDARIRATYVRMLESDPVNAAGSLADRGEWRAVPELSRVMDRLTREPIAGCDCAICACEPLTAVADAIGVLGGSLSTDEAAKLQDLMRRAEAMWVPFEDPAEPVAALRAPAMRGPRPGRNDPCPCGSGKKYKRCHLGADEGART